MLTVIVISLCAAHVFFIVVLFVYMREVCCFMSCLISAIRLQWERKEAINGLIKRVIHVWVKAILTQLQSTQTVPNISERNKVDLTFILLRLLRNIGHHRYISTLLEQRVVLHGPLQSTAFIP